MKTFTLSEFIAYLQTLEGTVHHNIHAGLEHSAKLIEERAKEKIGHYQDGWPELAESTKDERIKLGYSADAPLERSGELRDSITHSVDGYREAVVGSNEEKALYAEHGTQHQPPRPFLGTTAHQEADHVAEAIAQAVVEGLMGIKKL